MARTIRRRNIADIDPVVHHYLGQRMLRERSSAEENRDKKSLMEILEASGEKSPEGHRRLPLAEHDIYTNSDGEQKTVTGISRVRRVTQVLDVEAAMKLLKAKRLTKECTETVVQVSEDKILAANYEGKITDKELAALYGELENFAFFLEYK